MNHALVAGLTILLGIAAWAAHPYKGSSRPEGSPPAAPRLAAVTATQEASTDLDASLPIGEAHTAPEPVVVPKTSAPESRLHRNQVQTAAMLDRELGLSSDQRRQIEAIFLDRQSEVDAYHREVRASGVFHEKGYRRRIEDIRVRSYARMEASLDSRQAPRFRDLLYGGAFGDAIVFDIDSNLVVLD